MRYQFCASRTRCGVTDRVSGAPPALWALVALICLLEVAHSAWAAVLPHANSLNDLCPGTPNHCLVTAKWAVANGLTFDLGGRILELAPGAQLVGDSGASFSLINASQVILQKKSLISSIGQGIDSGSLNITST